MAERAGAFQVSAWPKSISTPSARPWIFPPWIFRALPTSAFASPWYAGIATLGVILAAVYLLVMFEKVFMGPVSHAENRALAELNWREIVILVAILVVIFWIGLYPKFFFDLMNPTVDNLVKLVRTAAGLP